jgi:hypothetical protein
VGLTLVRAARALAVTRFDRLARSAVIPDNISARACRSRKETHHGPTCPRQIATYAGHSALAWAYT